MKWFFALNQAAPNFGPIESLIKVAVHTALKHTSLEPHFLYDGVENELTGWLRERGVRIIPCRSFLYDKLKTIAEQTKRPHVFAIGAGAFLRTEIPRIAREVGITDRYVFYTDCDVMFLREVVDQLRKMQPRYFAVSPELDRNDLLRMNTGAMLMNLDGLARRDRPFRKFMLRHLEALTSRHWDQTAYCWFFNPLMRWFLDMRCSPDRAWTLFRKFNRRGLGPTFQWEGLPIEFNWKPYWDDFTQARIIHFHGPKPYERNMLLDGSAPAHLDHLKTLIKGRYDDLCAKWESELQELGDRMAVASH